MIATAQEILSINACISTGQASSRWFSILNQKPQNVSPKPNTGGTIDQCQNTRNFTDEAEALQGKCF